ncbi:hypothetical protein ACVRZD_04190 [Streptococcus hongkongensis]
MKRFYLAGSDKSWSSTEEVKDLVQACPLSNEVKVCFISYFNLASAFQDRLNSNYAAFYQTTVEQNLQLKVLNRKAKAIYKKFGITQEKLTVYYSQLDKKADKMLIYTLFL